MQVTEIGLGHSAEDRSILRLEYGYGSVTENNGSLRSQKITFAGLSEAYEQFYVYDDFNRLKSAEEKVGTSTNWKQAFVYDRYGNRSFDAANTTTISESNTVTNPSASTATNRLNGYTYDEAGNLTVDAENRRFVYDAENHQTTLFGPTNNSETPEAIYEYDGEGRRVKKISSTETTVFVYDGGGRLVAEYTAWATADPAPEPQVSYLTQDHLGSPRVVTNQNGAVIKRTDWMAFGEEVEFNKRTSGVGYDEVPETRKGYTGYEKDTESGLDFAQARYYNPKHGRFTSVDPLTASANVKNPQTFNRYAYVLNSPYKFTDPLGLIAEGAGGGWTCSFECRVRSAITSGLPLAKSGLSQADIHLLRAHIVAGTAFAHTIAATRPMPRATSSSTQQDVEAQLRSRFPTLSQPDGAVVNQAIFDAQNAATGLFSTVLVSRFRRQGTTITPRQALENIVASTVSSISVTREDGQIKEASVAENAVYDGRTSTLLVDDDDDSNTPDITVSEYFRRNSSVNAITYAGYIFVGQGFFGQNADGRAKSMVHEAVIHKGFGRNDLDFGSTRTEGSHAINAVIETYFRRRDPVRMTIELRLPSTQLIQRTP